MPDAGGRLRSGLTSHGRVARGHSRWDAGEAAQRRAEAIGGFDDYPYLAEIATKLPESGYDNVVEFAWGLDLIITAS